jgi:hypothetical protein
MSSVGAKQNNDILTATGFRRALGELAIERLLKLSKDKPRVPSHDLNDMRLVAGGLAQLLGEDPSVTLKTLICLNLSAAELLNRLRKYAVEKDDVDDLGNSVDRAESVVDKPLGNDGTLQPDNILPSKRKGKKSKYTLESILGSLREKPIPKELPVTNVTLAEHLGMNPAYIGKLFKEGKLKPYTSAVALIEEAEGKKLDPDRIGRRGKKTSAKAHRALPSPTFVSPSGLYEPVVIDEVDEEDAGNSTRDTSSLITAFVLALPQHNPNPNAVYESGRAEEDESLSIAEASRVAKEIIRVCEDEGINRVDCCMAIAELIKTRVELAGGNCDQAGIPAGDIISCAVWGAAKESAQSTPFKNILEVIHVSELSRAEMIEREVERNNRISEILEKDPCVKAEAQAVLHILAAPIMPFSSLLLRRVFNDVYKDVVVKEKPLKESRRALYTCGEETLEGNGLPLV